ncbi:MAG: nuclear transport factor 2 family protein [Gammaproteobacteria bacterium]
MTNPQSARTRVTSTLAVVVVACTVLTLGACSKKAEEPARETQAAGRAAQIAALESRADRVKDSNDIKRLQRAYGFYLDKAEWDQMADLFAAGASVEYANEGVYAGQNRIREYFGKLGGGHNGLVDGQMNNHMLLQPVVHVAPDGQTAKARWRALIQVGQFRKSASWGEGTYENEYVKDGGVWKIKKLHWYVSFVAPYQGGWAKMKVADALVGDLVKRFPPDQPPTVDYKPYPAAFVPPYHYENPVTGASTAFASAPGSDATLAPWELEVARLEAHDAVENLQGSYGYYFDKNQWDQVADLFTDDATYEIGQRGVYKGRQHLRQALDLIGPAGARPGLLNDELQLQPIIHVSKDGKTAKARWRTLEMKGVHGKSGQWGSGVYENEYALQDGRWKISKLHYYLTFRADYDKGWSKGTVPIEKASDTLPPDSPPAEVYGSLPDVYLPPFHYANLGSHPEPRPDLGAPPADLGSLAGKVGLLNDEIEVQNLQRSYGYFVDKSMWDEVTELFADDATLEIGGRGVFVGKKRVNEYMHFLAKQGPQHGWLFEHSQWQPITHVAADGKTAKQRLRAFVMGGTQGSGEAVPAFAVWGECTYENEYVKVNGAWKISKLYAYFNMYTPYSDGWGKTGMPNTKPEKRLPPDRPPTRVYATYPAAGKLPYHYPNPVSGQ